MVGGPVDGWYKRGVVAGSQALYRASLAHFLAHRGATRIAAEASSGVELIEKTEEHAPHFVVISLPLSGPAPPELIERTRAAAPSARIIALVDRHGSDIANSLSRLRGDVLLSTQAPLEALFNAVHSNSHSLHTGTPHPTSSQLSNRQVEVLGLAALALSNEEIARSLGVSPMTVKRHLADVFSRLQVRSRMEAVNIAVAAGLLIRGGDA